MSEHRRGKRHFTSAHLRPQGRTNPLPMGLERCIKLTQTMCAKHGIMRPRPLVEGNTRCGDRLVHVGGCRIRRNTEHLFGRRI
jgi:hypothetical protein